MVSHVGPGQVLASFRTQDPDALAVSLGRVDFSARRRGNPSRRGRDGRTPTTSCRRSVSRWRPLDLQHQWQREDLT